MEFEVELDESSPAAMEVRPGMVYPIRGGRGARLKHMYVVLAITDGADRYYGQSVLLMIIDKDGKPTRTQNYALHYIQELSPIGFVPGLEELKLVVQPL